MNYLSGLRLWLLGTPRRVKRVLQVLADVLLIWLALWLAFVLRLGLSDAHALWPHHLWLLWAAPLITIPVAIRFGLYRAVLRYLGNETLTQIGKALGLSAVLLALAIYWQQQPGEPVIPRSFIVIYGTLSLVLLGGLRVAMRHYFLGEWLHDSKLLVPFFRRESQQIRVAVYGAGRAGNQLVAALRVGRSMKPVAFIDDSDQLATRVVAGLKVYKPKHISEMLRLTGATQVLLAMPSASRARRNEILEMLKPYPLHVRTVPDLVALAGGQLGLQDVQELDVADLLGRDPVQPLDGLLQRCIANKVVMVTGAGGSIGSELCRQALLNGARVLVLFEHAEFNLYTIHGELQALAAGEGLTVQLCPVLGSVLDGEHLQQVMTQWQVDTLYHAAAYKHVPLVEHNPVQGVRNNLLGTLHTACAALRAGVDNFVLISTDKVVRPTSVMGCSKRLSEMLLQALSQEQEVVCLPQGEAVPNRTRFSMVRFGNVLGSSGSVIPLFRRQVSHGGPVTVTHPDITRYFMTIAEAAQLVIQAGAMAQGGEVFVLDMGEPVRIVELAEKMIALTGRTVRNQANPVGDIAIEFTGLRPGEKLYEELLINGDVECTEHPKIARAHEEYLPWADMQRVLQQLQAGLANNDSAALQALFQQVVRGYHPDTPKDV